LRQNLRGSKEKIRGQITGWAEHKKSEQGWLGELKKLQEKRGGK